MASPIADIKNGNIAPMYLFYGEEAFKKRHYKETLKQAVAGMNAMNCTVFEGRDIDWQTVYDTTQTLPFFAEKRLVIVENSGKFKAGKADAASNGSEEADTQEADRQSAAGKSRTKGDDNAGSMLEKILADLPDTTCIAFFEEGIAKNKKVYKTIASKGVTVECSADTEEQLIQWLAKGFAGAGKKVRRSTLELLTGRCGLDYDKLRSEFEKIVSYAAERSVIEDADILAVSSATVESRIFDMLKALSEKNLPKVLEKYYDLLANREHPLYIMAMLRSQFRTMLQVAELTGAGMSAPAAAKAAGKPLFVINNMKKYLYSFSREQIETILDEIAETDRKCKSGEIPDQIGVELLLIRFSEKNR